MNQPICLKAIILIACCTLTLRCHRQGSRLKEADDNKEAFNVSNLGISSDAKQDQEKITWLKKVGEIESRFCTGGPGYFLNITSLCIDDDSNLYACDSELHRVSKFDDRGNYLTSFGSEGQGPGEFLGTLKMSMGNDRILYVTDDGNLRLIAFSKQGEFIREMPIRSSFGDIALVNSRGYIYLLSPSGLRIIDIFNSDMKLMGSLLDMSLHLSFPFESPPRGRLQRMRLGLSIYDVKKLLTKDDRLIVFINNTQMVVGFDQNHLITNEFPIRHSRFIRDYKKRLKEVVSEGGWLSCFGSVCFDSANNLCFSYYNASLNLPEIYRYKTDGTFIDVLRAKNVTGQTNSLIAVCDKADNYYSISAGGSKIIKYIISET